jgi:RNA polymerase sigma-70 factor (ECF subfamily)
VTALSELVRRARRGDRAAFDELVRRTYVDTLAVARRYTGNEDDARDVVQEAYLRAYRGIRTFRGDARFSTWMYRITANCAATFHERRRRHLGAASLDDHADELLDASPDRDPELRATAALLRRDLESAVRRLPERLRTVLVLRDVYDLAHDEIADLLGITEGAAKVRLHRARRRLRDLVGPEDVGPESLGPSSLGPDSVDPDGTGAHRAL